MGYCSGRCKEFKAIKPRKTGRYVAGQKRCNFCEIFIYFEGFVCPCCKKQLRCMPRSKKDKEVYHSQMINVI